MADAENLISSGTVSFIFLFEGDEENENVKKLRETYSEVQTIALHKLDNITDAERSEKQDYVSIMENNLELLKKELYQ